MKIPGTHLSAALLLTAGLLAFSACKKTKETPSNPATTTTTTSNDEQTTSSENNLAENTMNDIDAMASEVTDNGSLTTFRTSENAGYAMISSCAVVTGVGTNTITVDFGSGCSNDGHLRSGKLIYVLASTSLHYRNPGFSVSVTSQNYMVDSVHVNIINKTITNTTPSNIPQTGTPTVNLTWAITASVSITKANGNSFTWNCNRTKELVNTNDSTCYHGQLHAIDWTRATVKLNGTSSGTNTMNESYSATISNLVREFNCSPVTGRPYYHPFVSGTISYTPGSRPTRLIDYGTGICDNLATITINGHTYAFIL